MKKKYFSVVELSVVIFIISLLITALAFTFNKPKETAEKMEDFSQMKNFKAAIEQYYRRNNSFPAPYTQRLSNDSTIMLSDSFVKTLVDQDLLDQSTLSKVNYKSYRVYLDTNGDGKIDVNGVVLDSTRVALATTYGNERVSTWESITED